jgi:Flp pilus assembly protein TadG
MGDDRGQSLIEFALASVIFFMTMFGTLEFGLAIWRYNMVSDLAQEGARWASVHGMNSSSPASSADVQTFVRSRTPGFTVNVTTTPDPSTVGAGGTVDVVVQSSYTPMTGLIPQATISLNSRARMVVSR